MRVSEIVALLPESEPILTEYGLHCFHCPAGAVESLGEGCRGHGFSSEEISDLVADLNTLLAERPKRPEHLTVTEEAARALLAVRDTEGRTEEGVQIAIDALGNFCMEFCAEPPPDNRTFRAGDVPLTFYASALTLQRIGGATIDFRDGRFKLDMPEDSKGCACGGGVCGAGCGCS
jgi:hybrid cluster-associated redox disulfide protein